ncbi:MAG: methylcrotonoyl-CoA carboxylase [Gallionella sp.]|nr:methylcrotonoyl-CoA carboxylase [Gallionella sp.]
MGIMKSLLSVSTPEFERNREAYAVRVADLHARRAAATASSPATARNPPDETKQLAPRERVSALLDPGSPFLELCQLAGEGPPEGLPPGAGLITGVGMVSGRPCMIIANDISASGGSYNGITCKVHVRAQRFAWQHRLPCITLVQPGESDVDKQADVFPDDGQFGSIFYYQMRMSRDGIAQLASVHGPVADSAAFVPALCDQLVIVRGQGALAFGTAEAPPDFDAERYCRESGTPDQLAESDAHAIAILRDIVANLGAPARSRWDVAVPREPLYDPREIHGIVSADPRIPTDNREIVLRLVDGSELQEFKPDYGETVITGFGRIKGYQVGIVCNNGVLFSESAMKATNFIELCCQRDIPLLFMVDINGFMVGREAEESGIAKHGSKMMTAMACANVPKYTLTIGAAYGAGYLAMCGRVFAPNAMILWPNSRVAVMGSEQVATTLAMIKDDQHKREGTSWTNEEREAFKAPVRKMYETFANAYNFARNTWCDMIIDPAETRDVMALLLDLAGRVPAIPSRFGVYRM